MTKKIKEKRTPCPFCKELIIDGAKKCRFCGELLKPSAKRVKKERFFKKKISIKTFYWIWLTTCAIFLLSIKLFATADSQFISSQIYSYFQTIFVLAIFIGGGTFIGLVVAILTSLNKKESRRYGLLTMGTFIVFFLIFFNHITQVESVADRNPLGPVEVVKAINKERESRGLETLVTETQLDSAAKAYAQDMCNNDYYIESNDKNKNFLDFIDDVGYKYNIAAFTVNEGIYDTNLLVEKWLENPQTKEILLSDKYFATGVGIVRCGLEVLGKTTDIIVQFYAEPTLTKTTKTNTIKNNTSTNGSNQTAPVHCNIHPNCGGGTTPLTKEECDNSTCCEVKPGEWVFMKDKTDCNNDGNPLNSGGKVKFTTTEAIVDGTYYCYENRVNELTRMESEIKTLQMIADGCNDSAKYEVDSCIEINCKNQGLDFSIEAYSKCLDDCYANSTDCLSKNEDVGNKRREYMNLIYQVCP